MELFLGALFIFTARTIDVSMATVRTIFTIRGKRLHAAMIGFVEVMIYITALGMIVQNLDKVVNIIAYGLGFASGILVGSKIEEKLALGFVTVQAILSENADETATLLRESGFGVTMFDACGLEGPKKVLNIFALRKNLHQLIQLIKKAEEHSFITVMDARSTMGGYIKMTKKK